jgi:RHS repeat-associated protein
LWCPEASSGSRASNDRRARSASSGAPWSKSNWQRACLTGQRYPDGTRVTLGYDKAGERTLLWDGTGRTTSSFDAVGRLSAVINPAGLRLTYAYDAASQRKYLVEPEGARFTYAFDTAGRISYVANPQAQRATYSYDAASRETGIHFANTTRASNSYDNADRLLRVANFSSTSTTLSSFSYALDAVGNRMHVIEATGNRVTWSYDKTYQLKNEQRSGSNSYNITYTYDPVGNRLVEINGGARTTSAYDASNQLLKSQASGGVTTYTFDAAGNLLTSRNPSNQRTSYTWDFENRLSQVALPSGVPNTFVYNGDGQRVQKQDSTGTTKPVWDGQNILLETDGSNIIQVVYTLEPAVYGNLISQRRGGTTSFYLFDGLGSTIQLASSVGAVTDTYVYDSFGNIVLNSGTTTNWFRFVGRLAYYYDTDSSDYYLRARFYDPKFGRFVTRDPLFINWGNLYLYADNNPLRHVDPSGKLTVTPLQNNLSPPCGGDSWITWDFILAQKKHCAGYMVQQIDMRCNVTACPTDCIGTCPNTSPVEPTLTYWEALYVEEDQPVYFLRQVGQVNYTDRSNFNVPLNSCGTVSAVGAIRFYCKKDTGDLGLTGIPEPLSGWKVGAQYCQGNCCGNPDQFPSTNDKKLVQFFWGRAPVVESATRSSGVYWRCCGQNDFVHGYANPE